MIICKNYNMKKCSNMKIGGDARSFIQVEEKEEIKSIVEKFSNFFIIGNGTNTLIGDNFLDIDFVSLKKLNKIKKIDDLKINVEAGVDFSFFMNYLEENNLSGLEELAGIPGTVGGLVFMNGGAYGKEIFQCVESIEYLNENYEIKKINKDSLKVGYRNTEIKEKKWIILSVDFVFKKGFNKEKVKEIKKLRIEKQPIESPNLGSTFKNPTGHFAAKLILDSGLQGKKIGGAEISKKHPNFIINNGNASYNDVEELIKIVKREVYKKTGVKLEEEIIKIK